MSVELSTPKEPADKQRRPYLTPRDGTYYFKRKVPTDAVEAFGGRAQVWKSLETSDLDVALIRLSDEVKKFDETVAKVRGKVDAQEIAVQKAKKRKPGTTKYLQEGHVPQIVEGYIYGILSTDDEERKGTTREERAERLALLEEGLAQMLEDSAAEDLERWNEVLEHQLEAQALIAPPGSELRQKLLLRLVKADIDLMQKQIERLKGVRHETPQSPIMARELLTLQELFLEWAEDKENSNQKTKDTYRRYVAEFEALVGAQPVVSITTDHAIAYRNHLAKRSITRSTAENHIGGLATLYRYGKRKDGLIDKGLLNPFEEIDTSRFVETQAHESRRAFNASELVQLFDSKLYTQGYEPSGQAKEALYWAPLLGLFAGLRLNEFAQLHTRDIKSVLGVSCIEVTDAEIDNSIKTVSSRRLVPIHEELIQCGFLSYVDKRLADGGGRLFPSLSNDNKYKSWSNALGKVHGRYLDDIGITDCRVDHHSYRYNFKQQCTLCGIDKEIRDALTGHWLDPKIAGLRYMRDADGLYPLEPLAEAIRKFRYSTFSLKHLYKKP